MVKIVKIVEDIEIPKDVQITLKGKILSVKGKIGSVVKDFSHARQIEISANKEKITLNTDFPRRSVAAILYTIKNVINNMFLGVQKGYLYKMRVAYAHFPITVEPPKKGSTVIVIKNFIGERAPRITNAIGDVQIKVDKDEVVVTGCDKEHVGQTCANIQNRCRIKQKDKRVFADGVYLYERYIGDQQLWALK
jgi:large subunit ribosomal protein L6